MFPSHDRGGIATDYSRRVRVYNALEEIGTVGTIPDVRPSQFTPLIDDAEQTKDLLMFQIGEVLEPTQGAARTANAEKAFQKIMGQSWDDFKAASQGTENAIPSGMKADTWIRNTYGAQAQAKANFVIGDVQRGSTFLADPDVAFNAAKENLTAIGS